MADSSGRLINIVLFDPHWIRAGNSVKRERPARQRGETPGSRLAGPRTIPLVITGNDNIKNKTFYLACDVVFIRPRHAGANVNDTAPAYYAGKLQSRGFENNQIYETERRSFISSVPDHRYPEVSVSPISPRNLESVSVVRPINYVHGLVGFPGVFSLCYSDVYERQRFVTGFRREYLA